MVPLNLVALAFVNILTAPAAFAFQPQLECARLLTESPHVPPEDLKAIQAVVDKQNLEIVVMAPNPASRRYRTLPGYAAKTEELKRCKTSSEGPYMGLVQCPEAAFASRAEWARNKAYLLSLGYEVLGAEQSYLVRRIQDGKYFFSDYDLFSARHYDSGQPAYTEQLRADLNASLGRRLVRHGPLADYRYRNDLPIKLPLLILAPGREIVVIETRAQLEREFRARNLPLW